MMVDMRKLNNGPGSARPVYQHGHFCVRTFHLLITYPIYSCFILFIIYLGVMDVMLYFQIRSRGLFESDVTISNGTNNKLVDQNTVSLPIKKIMVGPTTQHFRSPLAEFMESGLHFTYYFPFISANMISFFHCFLSLITIKFFSSESLLRRQMGVFIFEFRTFLDCLDGVVFRAHSKNQRYKSYTGGLGYYIDVISDILGGTCLIIGCLLYFYRHRPLRSITRQTNQSLLTRKNSSNNSENEETDLVMLNLEDEEKTPANNEGNLLETKQKIFIALVFFSLRYIIAAGVWDRDVQMYENLLDSYKKNPQQQALQLIILHSPLTILIFFLWRYLSAITIQDCLLVTIFFDRTWELVQRTSIIGWVLLLFTIVLTELHINQAQALFSIF